jgi:uncharacterized RDD family membrane protein YckC
MMKSKFQPDTDSGGRLPPAVRLIDPDAYDPSQQRFAASVDQEPASPRFVVDAVQPSPSNAKVAHDSSADEGAQFATVNPVTPGPLEPAAQGFLLPPELVGPSDPNSWRREVAARMDNYRARRRPRAPHYPSLQLKFDPPETSWTANPVPSQPLVIVSPSRLAVAMRDALPAPQEAQPVQPGTDEANGLSLAEARARIFEFPRSVSLPPPVFDGVAEPVVARPRILEVPELVLPPPALGGILMEPVEAPAKERRPGFELPLQAAPMSSRLWAGAFDGLLVVTAFAVFAYIFLRTTSMMPPLRLTVGASVILLGVFWMAYQYLLLVYAGTTPGLRLAHLKLGRFDGTTVPRKIRRWRVLASVLSGLSLALGYAWCFLDEDRLCWHDRITGTYMAPHPPTLKKSPSA